MSAIGLEEIPYILIMGLGILLIIVILLPTTIKIVREYERGVIFRLGRLVGARGPGLFLIIPMFEKMVKIDLRTITYTMNPQEVITKDNVTTKVDAVVYYRVLDPEKAVTEVEYYAYATEQMAISTLRSVIGQSDLDELLAHRDKINTKLQDIVDKMTESWGIKVSGVEVKDVKLPEPMQRAMAAQAEAERDRRARVTKANGEKEASKILLEAAKTMEESPLTIKLRQIEMVREATSEKSTTIVIMLPDALTEIATGMKEIPKVIADLAAKGKKE